MDGLSKDQLLAVLQEAKKQSERDWLCCCVSYWHALRACEIVGTKPDDPAFKRDAIRDGFLTIARVKGSERTTQELVEHPNPLLNERKALIEFAAKRDPNQFVFKMSVRTWERRFKRIAIAAGIPAHLAHPHVLKHTIIHHMIDTEGVKIHEVKKRAGHKSLQSTGRYLEIADSRADRAAGKIDFSV